MIWGDKRTRRLSAFEEIRLVGVRTLRGANFWSPRPLTRLDLAVGAFDEISSAHAPGVTEALLSVLPGLMEHRCNLGERGGFVTRLRHGTYAPHIVEHVALELQAVIGHRVGFGRARGGDRAGEYTVVLEHRHAEVGVRAAVLALELVQQVFAGVQPRVEHALAELRALEAGADLPPLAGEVLCGVTGGVRRTALRQELLRRETPGAGSAVAVSPAYILQAGLPYSRSECAVILDVDVTEAPHRYREPDRAIRLVSVVADAVMEGGWVIAPAGEPELHEIIRDAGARLAVFCADGPLPRDGARLAEAVARVRAGRVAIESDAGATREETLHEGAAAEVQVAAALVADLLGGLELQPDEEESDAVHA